MLPHHTQGIVIPQTCISVAYSRLSFSQVPMFPFYQHTLRALCKCTGVSCWWAPGSWLCFSSTVIRCRWHTPGLLKMWGFGGEKRETKVLGLARQVLYPWRVFPASVYSASGLAIVFLPTLSPCLLHMLFQTAHHGSPGLRVARSYKHAHDIPQIKLVMVLIAWGIAYDAQLPSSPCPCLLWYFLPLWDLQLQFHN